MCQVRTHFPHSALPKATLTCDTAPARSHCTVRFQRATLHLCGPRPLGALCGFPVTTGAVSPLDPISFGTCKKFLGGLGEQARGRGPPPLPCTRGLSEPLMEFPLHLHAWLRGANG